MYAASFITIFGFIKNCTYLNLKEICSSEQVIELRFRCKNTKKMNQIHVPMDYHV